MLTVFWNLLLYFKKEITNEETENKIGDEGAKAVAEMIKTNTTIQVIDLSGNHMREKSTLMMNLIINID